MPRSLATFAPSMEERVRARRRQLRLSNTGRATGHCALCPIRHPPAARARSHRDGSGSAPKACMRTERPGMRRRRPAQVVAKVRRHRFPMVRQPTDEGKSAHVKDARRPRGQIDPRFGGLEPLRRGGNDPIEPLRAAACQQPNEYHNPVCHPLAPKYPLVLAVRSKKPVEKSQHTMPRHPRGIAWAP